MINLNQTDNNKERIDVKGLLDEVRELYNDVKKEAEETDNQWGPAIDRDVFVNSAKNLSFYLALRRRDIREIQTKLATLGLSSFGHLESNTKSTIENVISQLSLIAEEESEYSYHSVDTFTTGRNKLEQNTADLFGPKPDQRSTRIMVTMSTEAADNVDFLIGLVKKGMNVARINCAHDDEETWTNMVNNIRKAEKETGKSVNILMDIAGPKIRTDWVFTTYKKPKVTVGDFVCLTKDYERLPLDEEVKVTVGCSLTQIFESLNIGDQVLYDDGSIEFEVNSVDETQAILEVKQVSGGSKRIKAEKGLNFPSTDFDIDLLTDKDKTDLRFASENADIIGCSFIRTPEDIELIQSEIEDHMKGEASNVKLVAKIETVQAIENLPEIILTAASKNPFSIMIARGDLAVESGYIRLAELQQEILWLGEAADIPVVWGTEVLANLIDEGIPTRSEVTDAAEGARSECVMLNKGDYIEQGVETLNDIFEKMEEHQYKKAPKLRALNIAKINNS